MVLMSVISNAELPDKAEPNATSLAHNNKVISKLTAPDYHMA